MTSTIDGLPPLREVLRQHNLNAQKSLGQNFLLDLNLTSKIARMAGDISNCDVLEIGPGPGGLTRGLLAEGARRVCVVEKDPRCLPALADIAKTYPDRLSVIAGDALHLDIQGQLQPPVRIVANLPYNIGTELLIRWLSPPSWPPFWSSLTLMFQKEVAERIVAKPRQRHYGRLALLAQWHCDAKIVMHLPPDAFTPPPKVHSAVVHITPLDAPRYEADPKALSHIVATAFNQRRKMLRASLKPLAAQLGAKQGEVFKIDTLLERAEIDPTARAEEIDLARFCALARLYTAHKNRP